MTSQEVHNRLQPLIDKIRFVAFTPEYRNMASDAEALGLVIARYFEWDGLQILETSRRALEDANFHTEAEIIQNQIEQVKQKFQA